MNTYGIYITSICHLLLLSAYKTYYGKYCFDYISDDHEGLDTIVQNVLMQSLNEYRKKKNIQALNTRVMVGILSFSSNDIIPTYSTDDEIKCFDFYYENYYKIYINGKLI